MFHVATGTGTSSPATACHLSDGAAFRPVQAVWQAVDDVGGQRLVWVPPIVAANVYFSIMPAVQTGDYYDAIIDFPAGTPEGARIEMASPAGVQTFLPPRGTLRVSWDGRMHLVAGEYPYTVTCRTAGGTTTFARTQVVHIASQTRVTISPPSVAVDQAFSVTFTSILALDAGDVAEFTSDEGHFASIVLSQGQTVVSLPDQVMAAGGDHMWTVIVKRNDEEVAQASANLPTLAPAAHVAVDFELGGLLVSEVEAGRPYDVVVSLTNGSTYSGAANVAVSIPGVAGTTVTAKPVSGAASVRFSGVQLWPSTTVTWQAVVSLGSLTATNVANLTVTDTVATAVLTGPAHALGLFSGSNATLTPLGLTVNAPSYAIAIANSEAVATAYLQVRSPTASDWTTYRTWARPGGALTSLVKVTTAGTWSVRLRMVFHDGNVGYSNTVATEVIVRKITAAASDTRPMQGATIQLTAKLDIAAPVDWASEPLGWYYSANGGVWIKWNSTANPRNWVAVDAPHRFMWAEEWPDGSVLWSNTVAVDAMTLAHHHVTLPLGGNIQAALDAACAWHIANRELPVNFDVEAEHACVVLTPGTWTLNAPLRMRRGVRLVATGCTFVMGSGMKDLHQIRVTANGGGSYNSPDTDWQLVGGDFQCQNDANGVKAKGISIVHTKRFRISGVTIRNVAAGVHCIEVNSSGGPRQDGTFNVQILNSKFFRDKARPAGSRRDDEGIQLDYAWVSSVAAAYNCTTDGTVTNNVLIDGCEFYHLPRAIGSHTYSKHGGVWPKGMHANIRITDCSFHDIHPVTWGESGLIASEATVRPYCWKNVVIEGNTFTSCARGVTAYIPASAAGSPNGAPDYLIVRNNTFSGQTTGGTAIGGNADDDSGMKWNRIMVEGNTLTGNWPGSSPGGGATFDDGYFVGFDDTAGKFTNSAYGVYIRNNKFTPSNLTAAQEKDYNKYRAANATNTTGVSISGNTVSDGTVNNS